MASEAAEGRWCFSSLNIEYGDMHAKIYFLYFLHFKMCFQHLHPYAKLDFQARGSFFLM
jgi:hypothetical protein